MLRIRYIKIKKGTPHEPVHAALYVTQKIPFLKKLFIKPSIYATISMITDKRSSKAGGGNENTNCVPVKG